MKVSEVEEELVEQETVIYSGPATVVLWPDGEKTVVKCSEGDSQDPVLGYLLNYYLHMEGCTRTQMSHYLDSLREVYNGD